MTCTVYVQAHTHTDIYIYTHLHDISISIYCIHTIYRHETTRSIQKRLPLRVAVAVGPALRTPVDAVWPPLGPLGRPVCRLVLQADGI